MAIDIEVDISGAVSALQAIFGRIQDRVIDALDESAALVQNSAKEGHPKVEDSIRGAAAAPFRETTPAGAGDFSGMYRFLTRTGVLRNSITIDPAKKTDGGYSSGVFSAVQYADFIEYSGYPFMRPALEVNRGNIQRRIAAAVRSGTGG